MQPLKDKGPPIEKKCGEQLAFQCRMSFRFLYLGFQAIDDKNFWRLGHESFSQDFRFDLLMLRSGGLPCSLPCSLNLCGRESKS